MSARTRLLVRLAVQALALIAADFLLLRVWAPDLINLHKDWALLASLACLLLAAVITAWLCWRLWVGARVLRTMDRKRPRAGRLE